MRPFAGLISKEDALARLLEAAHAVKRAVRVPLPQAANRVAAEDVRAPFDVPPYARSMMDGYAVRSADTPVPPPPAGTRLRIVGEVLAGAVELPSVAPGEAARIATGAPVPPGADAVVRVEDTHEMEGDVVIHGAARAGQSIEPAASDLARGEVVVRAGELLTPARLGLLASIGTRDVLVLAHPRVALFATGDELLKPGDAPHPLRIYESNTTALAALLEAHGAEVARMPSLPDDLSATKHALAEAARSYDLVLTTGGASAGSKDLVVDAVRASGEVLFHGVRVKPGKPLLAGRIGEALLVGLPGNPTSALSNACLFVVPALRKMARLPEAVPATEEAVLAADVKGEAERFLFLPVKLDGGRAHPTFKSSGALTSLAASDGWIGVPEGTALAAGARVRVTRW